MKRAYVWMGIFLMATLMWAGVWKGKVYREKGIKVVENYGEGIWGSDISSKVRLQKNLSIGKEEGEDYEIFSTWMEMAVGPKGEILILDRKQKRMMEFSRSGKFLWKAGKAGEGPGEFKYPFAVTFTPQGKIWVVDSGKIHCFSPQGKFLKSIPIDNFLGHIYFLETGKVLAVASIRGQNGLKAKLYDSQMKPLGNFPFEYRYGPKLPGGGGLRSYSIVVSSGKVLFMLPDKYEFYAFTEEGKPILRVKRKVNFRPTIIKVKGGGIQIEVRDELGPGFYLPSGYYVVQFQKFEDRAKNEEYRYFLDFYNKDGKFLGSLPLPPSTKLKTLDSRGNFYFLQSEPFPQVYRSKLLMVQ